MRARPGRERVQQLLECIRVDMIHSHEVAYQRVGHDFLDRQLAVSSMETSSLVHFLLLKRRSGGPGCRQERNLAAAGNFRMRFRDGCKQPGRGSSSRTAAMPP